MKIKQIILYIVFPVLLIVCFASCFCGKYISGYYSLPKVNYIGMTHVEVLEKALKIDYEYWERLYDSEFAKTHSFVDVYLERKYFSCSIRQIFFEEFYHDKFETEVEKSTFFEKKLHLLNRLPITSAWGVNMRSGIYTNTKYWIVLFFENGRVVSQEIEEYGHKS